MTMKQKLAKEYAILKKAVWANDGVAEKNNSETAHYKRAMRLMNIGDLVIQNERLAEKLIKATV